MSAVKVRRHVVTLPLGEGTDVSIMLLEMQSGDSLVSLRITPGDGRFPAAAARLKPSNVRLLITGLKSALEDLDANELNVPKHERARRRPE